MRDKHDSALASLVRANDLKLAREETELKDHFNHLLSSNLAALEKLNNLKDKVDAIQMQEEVMDEYLKEIEAREVELRVELKLAETKAVVLQSIHQVLIGNML